PQTQTCNGPADRLTRDLDVMTIQQILPQQRSGPDRRVVAEITGVGVDDLSDPGINAARPGSGAARMWGIGETFPEIQFGTFLEPVDPVVDRLAADVQRLGDRFDGLALIEPEQGLGAAPLLGQGSMGDEVFQRRSLPRVELERSHRSLPRLGWCSTTHCIC